MRKKVIGLFLIGMFIGLIGIVYGAICPDERTIVKVSDVRNSHTALWNDATTSYIERICTPQAIDRNCASPLFWLASGTNSHVNTIQDSNYNLPVCLSSGCTLVNIDNAEVCSGVVVASLYKLDNSHISEWDDENYPIKICCPGLVAVEGAYWADANGFPIINAEVGDTVKMIVPDTSLAKNAEVIFEVYENDPLDDDEIRVGDDAITGHVNASLAAIGNWTITSDDYSLSSDHDKYVFSSALNGESNEMSIVDGGTNAPILLDIMSPECGSYIYKSAGESNDVVIKVSDEDDIVTGTLTIDGSSYDVTNGVSTIPYIFSKAGNIKLILSASNSRGQSKTTVSNIMVIDESKYDVYVAACIDSPADYENLGTGLIFFNASSTTAIKYVVGTGIETIGKDKMIFKWLFSDGRTNPHTSGADVKSYLFYQPFAQAGDNWADLSVEVNL